MKSVIMGGYRHSVESPRYHFPDAELWLQSTSARAWDWILYGIGQPYCHDRTSEAAKKWWSYHGTFLHWLRKANKAGVEIVFDTRESNLITPEMLLDEETYPNPAPLSYRYGYDMGVEREAIAAQIKEYAA